MDVVGYHFCIGRDHDTNRIDTVQILSPHDLEFGLFYDSRGVLEIGIKGDEQRKRLAQTFRLIADVLSDQ